MVRSRLALVSAGVAFVALFVAAQAPSGPLTSFTATVADGGRDTVRIDILRWSTDAERDQLFTAWTQPGSQRDAGGKGARPAIDESDPAFADVNAGAAKGKGKGKAAPLAEPPKPPTSERSLATALAKAEIVGRLWSSSEVAGYSIRYAVRTTQADGERIVVITDRRLGAWNDSWKTASPSSYDFTVLELRLPSKGDGEGKASLAGKVAADSAAKLIALDNYATSPVIFKSVRKRTK